MFGKFHFWRVPILKPAAEFDEKEAADSMRQAAAILDVPLGLVKDCKRQGCRAFRGSRVYLRPLAEMIASGETETDTVLFPIPTGPGASPKTFSEFRELLLVAIRCGLVRASEIFEILIQQVIDRLDSTSRAAASAHPKHELEEFDKLTHKIHLGFGVASCLLDGDATDEYLRRSAAALERARKKFVQSRSVRRACK
jgi:hypothetical protein